MHSAIINIDIRGNTFPKRSPTFESSTSNFYYIEKTTTNSITYFCVTITQVLVQTCTTRGKQQWRYSSSILTRTRWRLAPLKFQSFIFYLTENVILLNCVMLTVINTHCQTVFSDSAVLIISSLMKIINEQMGIHIMSKIEKRKTKISSRYQRKHFCNVDLISKARNKEETSLHL